MRECKLLWHEDLSHGSVGHKGTPTSTLLKHSQRVLLLGNQVSSEDTKSTVTLIPGSTKELLHQERGSPHPLHKACHRRSTPSRRVEDVPASHQDSKDGRLTEIHFCSLKNQGTRHTTLLTHSTARNHLIRDGTNSSWITKNHHKVMSVTISDNVMYWASLIKSSGDFSKIVMD
jgi:hypothetical protein